MYSKSGSVATFLVAGLLAGCGGGSSDTVSQDSIARAEGVYSGTVSNGLSADLAFNAIVLPSDQVWVISGPKGSDGIDYVSNLLIGDGTSTSGSFSAANARLYGTSGMIGAAVMSASYVTGKSLSGTITSVSRSQSFAGTTLVNSAYSYKTPPSLAEISGSWTGNTLDGSSGSISITSGGQLSGSMSGCAINGTIQPYFAGNNVFEVKLQFGSAPCAYAGASASGIAVSYALGGGKRQLILGGETQNKLAATVFLATR